MLNNKRKQGLARNGRVRDRNAQFIALRRYPSHPGLRLQMLRKGGQMRHALSRHFQRDAVGSITCQQLLTLRHQQQVTLVNDAHCVAHPLHICQNVAGKKDRHLAAQRAD